MMALMSRITELTNRLLVAELTAHGIRGIVPSHGGILMRLYSGKPYTMQELSERLRTAIDSGVTAEPDRD